MNHLSLSKSFDGDKCKDDSLTSVVCEWSMSVVGQPAGLAWFLDTLLLQALHQHGLLADVDFVRKKLGQMPNAIVQSGLPIMVCPSLETMHARISCQLSHILPLLVQTQLLALSPYICGLYHDYGAYMR